MCCLARRILALTQRTSRVAPGCAVRRSDAGRRRATSGGADGREMAWDWLYNALEIGAVALCGAGAAARRRNRVASSAITVGMALYATADMYYSLRWGPAPAGGVRSLLVPRRIAGLPHRRMGGPLMARPRTWRILRAPPGGPVTTKECRALSQAVLLVCPTTVPRGAGVRSGCDFRQNRWLLDLAAVGYDFSRALAELRGSPPPEPRFLFATD